LTSFLQFLAKGNKQAVMRSDQTRKKNCQKKGEVQAALKLKNK